MYLFPVEIANGFSELDYDTALANVLLLEAAVLLIQDDLGVDRKFAVSTLEESRAFGRHRYSGHDDDKIVHEVMFKIATIKKSDPNLLAEYVRTDSELDFLAWKRARRLDAIAAAPTALEPEVHIKEEEVVPSLDMLREGSSDVSYMLVREGEKEIIVLDD